VREHTVVIEFNDLPALEAALAQGNVAAVLTEPALTNVGMVLPDPGFHEGLRALTRAAGTLLLIDETHTISTGPGGYSRAFGLEPDLFVLGKPVAVDYLDERKFATAAVGLARAAGQIIDLTYRQTYSSAAVTTWANLKDGAVSGGITRRWGVDDWGTRGCQGAYLHWLTGNSLLPAKDPDPTHTGIQIIDRTTVSELAELVAQAAALQQSLNNADGHLNPLGLADGALAFDIAPASVDAGTTHFEQIYQRATHALDHWRHGGAGLGWCFGGGRHGVDGRIALGRHCTCRIGVFDDWRGCWRGWHVAFGVTRFAHRARPTSGGRIIGLDHDDRGLCDHHRHCGSVA
jgi:hypothetical protein